MQDDNQIDDHPLADLPLWSDEDAHNRLAAVCGIHNVPLAVITELVSLQRQRQHQERARNISTRFEEILGNMD